MNIKINKEQADYLFSREKLRELCGSRLYGTNFDDSDFDYLVFYRPFPDLEDVYASRHQFQYDDIDNNVHYNFTTIPQFWQNLLSGDATINADIALFSGLGDQGWDENDILNSCRTYNVIKAYLGFAKRDIKDLKQGKGRNKKFHIIRGLYCAESLMDNRLPELSDIGKITSEYWESPSGIRWQITADTLTVHESDLRNRCNAMFNSGELTMYPKEPLKGIDIGPGPEGELIKMYIDALNIREFKY